MAIKPRHIPCATVSTTPLTSFLTSSKRKSADSVWIKEEKPDFSTIQFVQRGKFLKSNSFLNQIVKILMFLLKQTIPGTCQEVQMKPFLRHCQFGITLLLGSTLN